MKQERKFLRLCYSCREYKPKDDLIRITKNYKTGEIELNMENLIQGHSIYVCKNEECIKKFIKNKKKLSIRGAKIPENISEILHTVLKK